MILIKSPFYVDIIRYFRSMLTFEKFSSSTVLAVPPSELSIWLESLWWDKKGDWQKAHDLIDHLQDSKSAHVHAYLHRKEKDLWNARYWYNRAKKTEFIGSLDDEWEQLVRIHLF